MKNQDIDFIQGSRQKVINNKADDGYTVDMTMSICVFLSSMVKKSILIISLDKNFKKSRFLSGTLFVPIIYSDFSIKLNVFFQLFSEEF